MSVMLMKCPLTTLEMFRRRNRVQPLGGLAWVHPRILREDHLPPMLYEPNKVRVQTTEDGHKVTILLGPPPIGPRGGDIFAPGPLQLAHFPAEDFRAQVHNGLSVISSSVPTIRIVEESADLSPISEDDLPVLSPQKVKSGKPSPDRMSAVAGPSRCSVSPSKARRRLKFPSERNYEHKKFRLPAKIYTSSSSEDESPPMPSPPAMMECQVVLERLPTPVKTPKPSSSSSDCGMESVDESDMERFARGEPLKAVSDTESEPPKRKKRRKKILTVAILSSSEESDDPVMYSVFTPSPSPEPSVVSVPPTPGKFLDTFGKL